MGLTETVYRCWMMKSEEYELFYSGLLERNIDFDRDSSQEDFDKWTEACPVYQNFRMQNNIIERCLYALICKKKHRSKRIEEVRQDECTKDNKNCE